MKLIDVPMIEETSALPDGSTHWVLGAREENGTIELVGTAESAEEAQEMATAVINSKGWAAAFVGTHTKSLWADLSKVQQHKHGAGYYFTDRRQDFSSTPTDVNPASVDGQQ